MAEPVVIASERGEVGLAAGMAVLRGGGSAMDAVEAAVRLVESNEADHFVGVGGLPNLLGEVATRTGATYSIMTAGGDSFVIVERRTA